MTTIHQPAWKDLLALVTEAKAAAANAQGGELEKNDLQIAALKLERKLAASGFDELDAIPSIALPDVTQLQADVEALKKAVEEDRSSGGSWKGMLGGIVKSVTRLIPGVGGIIDSVLPK